MVPGLNEPGSVPDPRACGPTSPTAPLESPAIKADVEVCGVLHSFAALGMSDLRFLGEKPFAVTHTKQRLFRSPVVRDHLPTIYRDSSP
jgi:hypothetical protein